MKVLEQIQIFHGSDREKQKNKMKMPRNYQEAVAYIDELPKFTKKHTLEHTKEFLRKMNEMNIPVIIISAGIGNVIEEFLKLENDYYDNIKIISNFIVFENGEFKEIAGDRNNLLYYKATIKRKNIEWNNFFVALVAVLLAVPSIMISNYVADNEVSNNVQIVVTGLLIVIIVVSLVVYFHISCKNYELYCDTSVAMEEIEGGWDLYQKKEDESNVYVVELKKIS